MKQTFSILILLLGTGIFMVHAQYDYDDYDLKKKPKLPKEKRELSPDRFLCKLGFGGSAGLSFGDHVSVGLLPKVGYKPADYFELVLGFGYQFDSYKTLYDANGTAYTQPNGDRVKTNSYSLSLTPRVYVWKDLFVQGTYAYSVVDKLYGIPVSGNTAIILKRKEGFNNAFAGAGYTLSFGDKVYIPLQIMVNINKNSLWPTTYFFPVFEFLVYPCRN